MGGGWVHWHQPHAWAELTRAGQGIGKSDGAELCSWTVGGERRSGARRSGTRSPCARGTASWPRHEALPRPARSALRARRAGAVRHADDRGAHRRARARRRGARRLSAELEASRTATSTTPAPSACSRWHALSGYRLELTQETGGVYTFGAGTRGLIDAMAAQAPVRAMALDAGRAVEPAPGGVEVRTRNGDILRARTCVLTRAAERAAAASTSATALGRQARRDRPRAGVAGIKLWLRVRTLPRHERDLAGHPFGYLDDRRGCCRRQPAARRLRPRSPRGSTSTTCTRSSARSTARARARGVDTIRTTG